MNAFFLRSKGAGCDTLTFRAKGSPPGLCLTVGGEKSEGLSFFRPAGVLQIGNPLLFGIIEDRELVQHGQAIGVDDPIARLLV